MTKVIFLISIATLCAACVSAKTFAPPAYTWLLASGGYAPDAVLDPAKDKCNLKAAQAVRDPKNLQPVDGSINQSKIRDDAFMSCMYESGLVARVD